MYIKFVVGVLTSLLFVGCASSPSSAPSAASEQAPPIAAPVAVPAASAKRVVLLMTGPKEVTESTDWAELKREWKDTFADHAKSTGVEYEFLDSGEPQQGQEGTVLRVTINDYRIVGIGARIMFGAMTGNAYINSRIQYTNLRDGTVFGEQHFNTASSAADGVFAKVTPQQVDTIATEVFRSIASAK